MALSDHQQVLCKATALGQTDEMFTRLKDVSSVPGDLYDIGQSNFEDGCEALGAIGILAGSGRHNCSWRIIIEPDQVHDFLKDQKPTDQALAVIPKKGKEYLSGSVCTSKMMFARWVCSHFAGEAWTSNVTDFEPSEPWDLDLACGLYLKLQGT